MNNEENFHAGHRERMIERLLNSGDSLAEHELLEILLFSFLPRIDTNLIAHKLLSCFGNLKTLFNESAENIMSVKGIGKKTASNIVLIGKILKRIEPHYVEKPVMPFIQLSVYESFVKSFFKDLKTERFMIFLLDKKSFLMTYLIFDGDNTNSISTRTDDILHAFAILKPTSIVLAHNHPSGKLYPSDDDNLATAKFYMLCSLHGINLADHVIVTEQGVYSYHLERILDDYQDKYKIEKLLKESEEKNG